MSDLDSPGPESQSHVDHFAESAKVLPMDHHVQRERQTGGPDGGGDFSLPGMRTDQASDAVVVRWLEILKAELDMF
jgi:hypothetical protein